MHSMLPSITEAELATLRGEAATVEVKWAARLEFPTPEGPKKTLCAWVTRGYKYVVDESQTIYDSRWYCSLCADKSREDCLHSKTARQLLIADVRQEAWDLFAKDTALHFSVDYPPWVGDAEVMANVIEWYFNEVMKDERAMGQIRMATVWTMTLEEVLGVSPRNNPSGSSVFAKAFDLLAKRKSLTLEATIVRDYSERMEEFAYWERATGHKELHVSDFGGWACHNCMLHGDEYSPSAKEFPCIRNTTTDTREWIQAEKEDNNEK